jgi:nucleoporin NUP159
VTQPAFQIPTNGESLRALIPNPQAVTGELCAVVTSQGKLLLANMKERSFAQGSNGQVLKEQVSCAAWSTKGKQIVAGLGDGTMVQMTPKGDIKAEIPRPPELNPTFYGKLYVTA